LPTSVYERTTVALPTLAGVNVIPVVLPNVSVPSVAVNVSGSAVLPALASAILTGLPFDEAKTRDVLATTLAVAGAVIAGGQLLTVRATLVEAER